ncbi:MAG: WG repeat-containing protein [Eubacteriales bacterium]
MMKRGKGKPAVLIRKWSFCSLICEGTEMSFYNYSVKKLLSDYFGENAIEEMRKPHESVYQDEESPKHILELSWQYADEQALDLFLEANYLLDTSLEDDYIAYTYQFAATKKAFIMFMVTEEEPFFHIDVNYAKRLIEEWTAKGYETKILRECIGVDYYGVNRTNGFHLVMHSCEGRGSACYELQTVNGEDIVVFSMHTCWEFYYKKLLSVVESKEVREYECLFEPDVELTAGDEKNKKTISKGIPAIKEFLESKAPLKRAYQEFCGTKTYSQELVAGDTQLILYVDRCNLISEINVCKLKTHDMIVDDTPDSYGSLQAKIPELKGIRVLNPVQVHGYAVQLDYGEENKRNYYLATFDDLTPPDGLEIDGYRFTDEVLKSVRMDGGALAFNNGYIVPKHLLYYKSYRQVNIIYTGNTVYEDADIKIRSIYKLPLTQFYSHFSVRQYWGFPDECYGPKKAWINKQGLRTSDIAVYSIDKGEFEAATATVCVEPTAKYGYIREDGSWLLPPIYDSAEPFSEGCAKATRKKNGEDFTCLITASGEEIPFHFPIDVESFTNDRCPFNAEEWKGKCPDAGEWYDCDWVKPGKWGFIDSAGRIIVEPKYVYVIGYFHSDGEHSIVARFVDGELKWGVIDLDGNEVIPCEYAGMFSYMGESIAFQREQSGLYGLMDYNGNILLEPTFNYIQEYDYKHSLVSAGEHGDALGVYSIPLGKMIIPAEYDNIDYDEHMISCEKAYSCKERYFDYDGNELNFDEYDSVNESEGLLYVWENGKIGVMDWDGNLIIPPVMEYGFGSYMENYKKGLLITGSRKLKGLSKTTGEVILPEVYSEIHIHGDYVIASKRTASNRTIYDTLLSVDGRVILEGLYRRMNINSEEKTMTVETPTGLEFFEIETTKSLKDEKKAMKGDRF